MNTKRNVPFHSPEYRCLNCDRLLRSEPKIWDNEFVFQDCGCGHRNYFDAIDDHWEQTALKLLPKLQKVRSRARDSKPSKTELFPLK